MKPTECRNQDTVYCNNKRTPQHKKFRIQCIASLGILVILNVLLACSPTDVASPPQSNREGPLVSSDETTMLDELTRSVAIALNDNSLRMRIISDMRNAPYLEHKLDIAAYLRSNEGRLLRDKMRSASDLSEARIEEWFSGLPRLEMYMPVVAHRRAWVGTDDVLVASAISESSIPIAYDVTGRVSQLDIDTPPAVPTLVLVPVETDFSRPIDTSGFDNVGDAAGGAIGQYIPKRNSGGLSTHQLCYEDCGGTSGGDPPPGIYMTADYITDLHEPWIKGEPEIEIHAVVESNGEGSQVRCVRESAAGSFHFKQNDHDWVGLVRLVDQSDLDALPEDQGATFFIWEDDNTECAVQTDGAEFANYFDATVTTLGTLVAIANGGNPVLWAAAAGFAVINQLFPGEDDYVGEIVPSSGSCFVNNTSFNHKITRDGSLLDGCATLESLQ